MTGSTRNETRPRHDLLGVLLGGYRLLCGGVCVGAVVMLAEIDPLTAGVIIGLIPWLCIGAYCLWNRWCDGPADNQANVNKEGT